MHVPCAQRHNFVLNKTYFSQLDIHHVLLADRSSTILDDRYSPPQLGRCNILRLLKKKRIFIYDYNIWLAYNNFGLRVQHAMQFAYGIHVFEMQLYIGLRLF